MREERVPRDPDSRPLRVQMRAPEYRSAARPLWTSSESTGPGKDALPQSRSKQELLPTRPVARPVALLESNTRRYTPGSAAPRRTPITLAFEAEGHRPFAGARLSASRYPAPRVASCLSGRPSMKFLRIVRSSGRNGSGSKPGPLVSGSASRERRRARRAESLQVEGRQVYDCGGVACGRPPARHSAAERIVSSAWTASRRHLVRVPKYVPDSANLILLGTHEAERTSRKWRYSASAGETLDPKVGGSIPPRPIAVPPQGR
jgi:hypothetical protein